MKRPYHMTILSNAPPSPGESRGRHCPKEIAGLGPIPARIRGFLILILVLSTAPLGALLAPYWRPIGGAL